MDAGTTAAVPVSASDVDGDPIVLSLQNPPAFATISSTGGNGTITLTPGVGDAGTHTITVRAAANGDVTTTTFDLIVTVNQPPSINAIADQTMTAGQTLGVNVTATDPEGDAITLALQSPPAFATLSATGGNGTITFAPTASQNGSYTIVVNATANGATTSTSFTLTVNPDVCASAAAPGGSVFHLTNPTVPGSLPDSNDINLGNYNRKVMAVRFRTGSDVTSRQMIYEQGGSTKGLNVYIDGGKVYAGIWSFDRRELWNDRFFNANIQPNTSYHVVLILDKPNASFYINGNLIATVNDVGQLRRHSDDIGIGQVNGGTVYHSSGTASNFTGTIFELIQWNSRLNSSQLNDLHTYFDCGNSSP